MDAAAAVVRGASAVRWAAAAPIPFVAAVAAVCLLPAVRANGRLTWSIAGAAALLAVWHAGLWVRARRREAPPAVAVDVRAQHYVQACAQGAVLAYWGFHWREVYDAAPLLAAQVAFAYAFDLLLAWSRRGAVTLGFAPIPVVFSINLFLWFKPDWFAWQFLLIAGALAGRELIRWERGGRRVHVFNPSSIALGAVSVGLLATGGTSATWGREIAATMADAPHMYAVIVLASLPGQALFGVATMTLAAAVTLYGLGLGYFALTGTYWFVDSYIPVAVFLGMHLLITDPSTSPRSESGRLAFGAFYAASVFVLYALLGAAGAPAFYDKLLAVPLLNLAVRGIDRIARRPGGARDPSRPWDRAASAPRRAVVREPAPRWGLPRLEPRLAGRARNVAWAGVWIAVFLGMTSVQAVGDTHRGQWVTFWLAACADGRPHGCRHAARLTAAYCDAGSGWACNEYGVLVQPALRPALAAELFARACALGFTPGCANLDPATAATPERAPPADADLRIVLRGRTRRLASLSPAELRDAACAQGFQTLCGL
ncbi:MAG: hypothetical protein OXF93_12895 [Acidobacteria bacterium]|nr:hypothetical protein [Acidobacteriota bacterium]